MWNLSSLSHHRTRRTECEMKYISIWLKNFLRQSVENHFFSISFSLTLTLARIMIITPNSIWNSNIKSPTVNVFVSFRNEITKNRQTILLILVLKVVLSFQRCPDSSMRFGYPFECVLLFSLLNVTMNHRIETGFFHLIYRKLMQHNAHSVFSPPLLDPLFSISSLALQSISMFLYNNK